MRKPKQISLLDILAEKEKVKQEVLIHLRAAKEIERSELWRGLIALPPGTILEDILATFRAYTNLPLEIPFFTFLSLLAGYLTGRGVHIWFDDRKIFPDIWTIVVAESSRGKTYVKTKLQGILPVNEMPDTASAAAFIEALSNLPNGKGIWIRDEMPQFLKQVATQTHMHELKDYLLRLYDNAPLERKTKKYHIIVDEPALVILGFSQADNIHEYLTLEDVVSGLAQRFGYIMAPDDPDRPFWEFPLWELPQQAVERWKDKLREMLEGHHERYSFSEKAKEAFRVAFRMLVIKDLDESFYRRIMFRGIKFALLYHFLTGKAHRDEIDEQDMGWASRLVYLQLKDACQVLDRIGLNDFQRILQKAEQVKKRFEAEGKPLKVRDLISRVREIKNATQARLVMYFLENLDKPIEEVA